MRLISSYLWVFVIIAICLVAICFGFYGIRNHIFATSRLLPGSISDAASQAVGVNVSAPLETNEVAGIKHTEIDDSALLAIAKNLMQQQKAIDELMVKINNVQKVLMALQMAQPKGVAVADYNAEAVSIIPAIGLTEIPKTPNQIAQEEPAAYIDDDEIEVYPRILISEIQIASSSDSRREFVELYNPNDDDVDLTDWYMQRQTITNSRLSSFASKSLFKGKKITAHGYFLIARKGYFSNQADIEISSSLGQDNALLLKAPNQSVIDRVGWGVARDFIAIPALNPQENTTIGRRFELGQELDFGNNFADFPLNIPTPRSQNIMFILPPAILVQSILDVPAPSNAPLEINFDAINPPEALSQKANESDPLSLDAADSGSQNQELSIVINEIAWMGSPASVNHEWIELYNSTDQAVDLSGWRIMAADESPLINLVGSIRPHGFFLLERTSDDSVSGILADQIYTGALGNSGEDVILYDSADILVDEVACGSGWIFGDNTTKQTMERLSDGTWQTSHNPGGTPKSSS